MKIKLSVLVLCLFVFTVSASADSYEEALSKWKSHEDVAAWLKKKFTFDKTRQRKIIRLLKKNGPSGMVVRKPAEFYEKNRFGYCADAAHFAITSLNRINPDYNARWVFVWNQRGRPNHWVAAFDWQSKLYILDYGAGKKFEAMKGVHGPYDSLEEYREYLATLSIDGFKVGKVEFMEMPGKEE